MLACRVKRTIISTDAPLSSILVIVELVSIILTMSAKPVSVKQLYERSRLVTVVLPSSAFTMVDTSRSPK